LGELVYMSIQSLDGYVADERGDFSWAFPGEEVHAFVNDLTRPIGTHLLGRRMYEVMEVWDRPDEFPKLTAVTRDFADVWREADKVVYSRTLESVWTERTRLEREFDPDAVRVLKESSERDLSVGGPGLAAAALRAGLVDELQLFLAPAIIGGGNASLPAGLRLDLELVEERRFDNGMAYLRYRTVKGSPGSSGASRPVSQR
jgi:dihydrofolate reductase